jgi:hypothetical protein
MKTFLFSIFAAAAISLPAAAVAGHHGHAHGGHACDSNATCPLGHKDCDDHKNCPSGPHQCTAGSASMDSNKDGKVSLKEFTAAHDARMKEKFSYLDANGDGFITDADREARKAKRIDDFFATADADKDGKLSKDEYAAAKKARWQGKRDCPLSNKGK